MDATPESFAYRCLPLNIANAHGWEVLTPCGFEAIWNGGGDPGAVTVTVDPGSPPNSHPVSLFGQGVITFHMEAIFRTPPGWNLWAGGSPNRQKDGIAPLTGIIETDWSPFTFTMNWRFTRTGCPVRFEVGEPVAFLFPVQRGALERFTPTFAPMDADPETARRFDAWSAARDAFQERMRRTPPNVRSQRWQKHYYRGVTVDGEALVDDHQSKLRLKPFDRTAAPHLPQAPSDDSHLPAPAPLTQTSPDAEIAALRLALAKREWLLEMIERQRDLAPGTTQIERRLNLRPEEFLERYYAPGRPVILTGEMDNWPALSRWTPDYLKQAVGSASIEYQGGRSTNPRFEMEKDAHRRTGPFDAFIESIRQPGNDSYMTAYNAKANRAALAPLARDVGVLDKYLTGDEADRTGMLWIGPAGTKTSLHHDLTNNFIAQLVGRKQIKVAPASEVGRLYNHAHVFSEIADLDDPTLDVARFPKLAGMRLYDVVLQPGEIIFLPAAWWHEVKALDFSVTATYTNFRWRNDAYATYPQG
jgi:hypothetical protein